MQAASAAFGAEVAGVDLVVEHKVRVRLPIRRTNCVPNPSFEYAIEGWDAFAGTNMPTIVQSAAQSHGQGDFSLRITWNTNAALGPLVAITTDPSNPGTVTLAAGSIYTYSAWVFVPAGSPAVVLAVGLNSSLVYSSPSVGTGAWQRLSVTFTADGEDAALGVQPNAATTGASQVYVDEVLLEISGTLGTYFDGDDLTAINLLGNPSFEHMLMPDVWKPVGCAVTRDRSWAVDGDYSAATSPTGTGSSCYVEAEGGPGAMRCGIVAGRTYTLSATVHVPAPLVGGLPVRPAGISIITDNGSGQIVTFGGVSAATLAAGGTERLAVTLTIPSDATQAWVRLHNGYTNVAANVVAFDAVMLRRDSVDAAYFGGRRLSDNAWTGTPGLSPSTLAIDPYPDLTLAADNVQVQRAMTTDLPAGTRLISGVPTATATLALSGQVDPTDETKNAGWLLNPYEPTSPLFRLDGIDADVEIQQGLITDAGEELIVTFTGGVDSIDSDSSTGVATLHCLDRRNKLRPETNLPAFAYQSSFAGMAPSLTGGWVMDAVLRQNGLHTSPPPRARCAAYVSLHGAAWPEVMGTVQNSPAIFFNTCARDLQDPDTFTQNAAPSDYLGLMVEGPYGRQVVKDSNVQNVPLVSAYRPNVTSSGVAFFEGWVWGDPHRVDLGGGTIAWRTYVFGSQNLGISWDWSAGDATASPTLHVTRTAGTANKALNGSFSLGAWHHVATFVKFTGSTTATVTIWIDGVVSTTNVTGLNAAAASEGTMTLATFICNPGYGDSFQITTESAPQPVRGFYASAYLDASLNALVAVANTAGLDPWAVMQALSEAELGVAGFDEHSEFRFRNRDNIASTASARRVTATESIKGGLAYTQGKSMLANHVTQTVDALDVNTPAQVWAADSVIGVAANKSKSFLVSTNGPVLTPQNTDAGYIGGPGGVPGQTWWRAAKSPGGNSAVTSGITVTTVSISATTLRVTVKNTNSFNVYMVNPTTETSGSPGDPMLFVGGALVTVLDGQVADSVWQPSIDARGEVALALPANVWIQDIDSAQVLTDDTVANLYRPRPILAAFTILFDPRLQLTDRISVYDPDGSKVDDDVAISGITITDNATAWDQALEARALNAPGDWIMGKAGRSELGSSTYT